MKPVTYFLLLILSVDAVAWAYLVGVFASLFWFGAALGVIVGHRWLQRQDGRMPAYRARRRLAV
jgi:hypothetical protein